MRARAGRGSRGEKKEEREYEWEGGIRSFISPLCFFQFEKKLTYTELLWTGSRGEGVFQFDQRASLETRTADGVVSFWRVLIEKEEREKETATVIERKSRQKGRRSKRADAGVCFFLGVSSPFHAQAR